MEKDLEETRALALTAKDAIEDWMATRPDHPAEVRLHSVVVSTVWERQGDLRGNVLMAVASIGLEGQLLPEASELRIVSRSTQTLADRVTDVLDVLEADGEAGPHPAEPYLPEPEPPMLPRVGSVWLGPEDVEVQVRGHIDGPGGPLVSVDDDTIGFTVPLGVFLRDYRPAAPAVGSRWEDGDGVIWTVKGLTEPLGVEASVSLTAPMDGHYVPMDVPVSVLHERMVEVPATPDGEARG